MQPTETAGTPPVSTVSGERTVTRPRTSIVPSDPAVVTAGGAVTVTVLAPSEPSSSSSTSTSTVSPADGVSFTEAAARCPFAAFSVTLSTLPPALMIACRLTSRTIVPRTSAWRARPLSETPSATPS